MRKLFTLATAVLTSFAMWAVDIYKTDFSETLASSATSAITKGAFETPSVTWKGDFTTCFHTSGSAGAIKITFDPAISLADYSDVKLKVFWGSPSNRPLKVAVNDGELVEIDKIGSSAERNQIREAETDITATSLTSLNLTSSGGGDVYMFRLEITGGAKCEAPAEALKFEASKTSEVYAGDEITFTISGGNGAEKTLTLDGSAFTADKWTAVAGEHTFVLSQDVKDGKCGDMIELKLTVASTDPVAKAEIEGKATAVIDKEATLTCKAENATNWQWYKGEAKIEGATEAEYKFTPDAAGELKFSCEAWNKFTDPHVKSAEFTVTVTEGACGVLALIEVKAKDQATLTGEFAGTAAVKNLDGQDKNKSVFDGKTGFKLYKEGSSIGADFTDGTLKAKDKVIVFVTTASAKMQIFGDKDGNKLLKEIDNVVQGENVIVLDDEAEGATGLYVIRKLGGDEGAKYNPHIAYIQLKRPCGEESSDASLKSLTIGGKKVDPDAEGVYNYEVPADYTEDQISIAYELNDAKAQADKPSPREVLVPEAGAEAKEVTITVTAEDGTQVVYVVKITKAAAQGGEEQPGGEQPGGEQPGGEQPGGEQPGGEQPGGDSDQAIDEVQGDRVQCTKVIRDGQLVILKNGILYNAQGAILK